MKCTLNECAYPRAAIYSASSLNEHELDTRARHQEKQGFYYAPDPHVHFNFYINGLSEP